MPGEESDLGELLDRTRNDAVVARDNILLMTATIAPAAAMMGTARVDPDVRRKDYLAAFVSYLRMAGPAPSRILFCENSGADLADFREAALRDNPHDKAVDFLSFRSDAPTERGKGFAELDILDRAYETFLRKEIGEIEPAVWKVTGRLLVSNLAEMIEAAPLRFDLYADFRSVPLIGERLGGNDWMDTRLFAFTPSGYKRLLHGCKDRVGWTIEKSIFAMLRPTLDHDPLIVPRFRRQPVFVGVCGGSAVDYGSAGSRFKTAVRSAARRIVPTLWL